MFVYNDETRKCIDFVTFTEATRFALDATFVNIKSRGRIYDTVHDITYVLDADYFETHGHGHGHNLDKCTLFFKKLDHASL